MQDASDLELADWFVNIIADKMAHNFALAIERLYDDRRDSG